MIAYQIKCDNCNIDLSTTSYSIDYCLKLSNEIIPCHPGMAVSDLMVLPLLKNGDCHFCELGC